MGIARGPNIVKDDLVFGYDTGYGVANNETTTRFYPGEPTVNYVTDSSLLQNGWNGSYSLIDSATKSFQFNVSSFHTDGAGWRSFMWDMRSHNGSAVTISATIEVPDDSPGTFAWVMMGQGNSGSGGTTTATYLGYSATSERYYKSTRNTERITWSGTIGNTGTANQPNGIIGFTVWYNGGTSGTNHFIKVSNVQIEKIAHETPFVNGTRSVTASLIDLKRTTSIDVSNVSFDSNAQPDFDGTDDKINGPNFNLEGMSTSTLEAIIYMDDLGGSHNSYSIFGGVATGTRHGYHEIRNSGSGWKMTHWTSANGWRYANTALSAGQYYHVVWVWNGLNLYWYLNGEADGNYTFSTFSPYSLGFTTIGSFGTERFMDGKIPVAKVYDTNLSAAEIKQNFNAYKNRFNT